MLDDELIERVKIVSAAFKDVPMSLVLGAIDIKSDGKLSLKRGEFADKILEIERVCKCSGLGKIFMKRLSITPNTEKLPLFDFNREVWEESYHKFINSDKLNRILLCLDLGIARTPASTVINSSIYLAFSPKWKYVIFDFLSDEQAQISAVFTEMRKLKSITDRGTPMAIAYAADLEGFMGRVLNATPMARHVAKIMSQYAQYDKKYIPEDDDVIVRT